MSSITLQVMATNPSPQFQVNGKGTDVTLMMQIMMASKIF
jgi:hypothetical protein